MVKEPSEMTIVIKNDEELLQWLERVRREGITMAVIPGQIVTGPRWVVERIEVGESEVKVVMRAERRRPGVEFPHGAYVSTATEEEVQKALSLAGVWKDLDTEAMLHNIYELRHRSETRPPVTFDD